MLVDADGGIIAGHGRVEAAKLCGMTQVPTLLIDHLTEAQKRAYIIADNRLAEDAGWDDEILRMELIELDSMDFNIELTGFDLDFIQEEPEVEEDEAPEVDEENEPITKLGDIWQLGRHRLMCGDSTNEEDVEKLMNGIKADMVFTDPPYNIAYSGIRDKRTIENDKMSDEDFVEFLQKSIMKCDTAYVCCSWQYEHLFKKAMTNIGMQPKAMIIWNKVNPAQHLDKYFKQHEIIFYYGKIWW